ncbi:hypothetical protein E2562_003056 [Oryza meyeriana var. granulata]|uniref:Uncharacterized protein n=1 Tax=Oryza meyeriana var. granulata TaxID=110450 RepID=A0A6G1DDQ3_9ORYZ|nr:hypothetical protein E2562_003056 [Oryza meyeriana var. granulata]
MLNSTVELIALWASSSSPSLLAFCVSHLIIALLLLAGRGAAPEISGGGRADGEHSLEADARVQVREDDALAAIDAGEECWVRVGDGDAVEIPASEKVGALEEESAAVDALLKKHGDDGEDELMLRAEEFIRRMNRVWMAENLRVC